MTTTESTTTTKTTQFVPTVKFEDTDETVPYRLVGTYEYDRALKLLTQLVQQSTPEQIKVYNKVLQDRAEFTFLNGIGLEFDRKPDLAKATELERKKFNDKFKKGGIAWMMALAKVELGATISMWGDLPFPFESLHVTEFDGEQFKSILTDDVIAHLRSLKDEPKFKEVLQNKYIPDMHTIAYLRRLKLVKDMLITLSRANDADVASRIRDYQDELEKYQKKLVTQVVRSQIGYSTESTTTRNNVTSSFDGTSRTTRGRCQQAADRLTGTGGGNYPVTTRPPRSNNRVSSPGL